MTTNPVSTREVILSFSPEATKCIDRIAELRNCSRAEAISAAIGTEAYLTEAIAEGRRIFVLTRKAKLYEVFLT